MRYAFHELNFNHVELDVIGYNKNAIKTYEKVGFITKDRMRSVVLRDGNCYDRIIMGILKHEWITHTENEVKKEAEPLYQNGSASFFIILQESLV